MVAAGVIVVSLAITVIAGQSPQEYLSVDEVRDRPGAFADEPVQVVAVVVPGTIEQGADGVTRFVIRGETLNSTLDVAYGKGLTDAFGADKWVVLTGTVDPDGGPGGAPLLNADDVQVGCPSKWDSKRADYGPTEN